MSRPSQRVQAQDGRQVANMPFRRVLGGGDRTSKKRAFRPINDGEVGMSDANRVNGTPPGLATAPGPTVHG